MTINYVVTPRFSRRLLIISHFQPLTEKVYILDIRKSARRDYCMMIILQDFDLSQWF